MCVHFDVPKNSIIFTDVAVGTNVSDRFCHVCGIDLKYPSKLSRHLQSKGHKMFEANLQSQDIHVFEHDVGVDAVS